MNVNYVILIPHSIPRPREKVCDGPALVSLTSGLWKTGSSRKIKEIWSEKFDFHIIIFSQNQNKFGCFDAAVLFLVLAFFKELI